MTMAKGYPLRVLWEIWGRKRLFKKTREYRGVEIFDIVSMAMSYVQTLLST